MADMLSAGAGRMQRPPPGGGMPPGGGGAGPEGIRANLQKNMSMFNPADAAMMKKQIDPQMTLRQFFQSQGYDVDRTTLLQFAQDQAQKAQPVNKAKILGGQPPMGAGTPPMGAGVPPMGGGMPPMRGAAPPMGGGAPPADLGGMISSMRKPGM